MRILLTADPELPVPPRLYGGIERIIDVLARGLMARGCTVAMCAHRDSTVGVNELIPWPGEQSQSRGDTLRNLRTLRRAVKSWKPDLVHSFSRLAYLFPILPMSVPKIMSYQRNPSLRTTRWARRLSRGTLTFTGCSEHICRIGRAAGGEWTAIHNCVELDRFTFQPEVADDAPLVFLSRVDRIKGAHTAIEIARRSGRRLIIAGNHATSGPEFDYWQSEIVPQIGRDRIEYMGPVDDVAKNELLGQAVAMLVPIQWDEPFGIVFAESLACGTPVISRARGALPEIVVPGRHGFLIDSVEDGVAAVQKLGEVSRQACRSRAEEGFSADAIVNQYLSLYQSRTGRSTPVSSPAGA